MRSALVLARKETRQLFVSPIAYAFLMVFVLFVTFMFFRDFFLRNQASLQGFFVWFPFAFAMVIPGITMRMWAEERKQGTIEFLLTSPVRTWQIVAGKFLAGTMLLALCVLLTLLVPYTVSRFGDLDSGPVWGGYLGSVLMGTSCLAVGMFCSSFAQDQIVAFLVTLAVLLVIVLMGYDYFQSEFGPGSLFGRLMRDASPTTYFQSVGRGVVDLRDLYYFGSVTALFLYLNTRVIDLRRWR